MGKDINPREYATRLKHTSFWGAFHSTAQPAIEDAGETNLAPLFQLIWGEEQKWGLIDQPRLDIILTDGEFENQDDADLATTFQHRRGIGVTTYILNLGPKQTNIQLPPTFREIPLEVIHDNGGIVAVDEQGLRSALNRVVLSEIARD